MAPEAIQGVNLSQLDTPFKVFLASPGDVEEERAIFRAVVDDLNNGFAKGADARLVPLMWDYMPPVTGHRPQAYINGLVDECDAFILILHERWGNATPGVPFSSNTEEEFQRAQRRLHESGVPQIALFFKDIDIEKQLSPTPQIKKVLRFRQEASLTALWKPFFTGDLAEKLTDYLQRLIKGTLPTPAEDRPPIILQSQLERLDEAEKAVKAHTEQQAREMHMAREAAEAAQEGRIEEAHQKFDVLSELSTHPTVLDIAAIFYLQIGEPDRTEKIARSLVDSGEPDKEEKLDLGLHLLGIVMHERGDLEEARKFCEKSLEISRKRDNPGGIADDLGNLSHIYAELHRYDEAIKLIKEADDLSVKHNLPFVAASVCGTLASIYRKLKNFEFAYKNAKRALEYRRKLPDRYHLVSSLCMMAHIQMEVTGGDHAESFTLYTEALSIAETLQYLEGVTEAANGLGLWYNAKGLFEQAEVLYRQSIAAACRLRKPNHLSVASCNLASMLSQTNRQTEALELFTSVLEDLNLDLSSLEYVSSRVLAARFFLAEGDRNRAITLYDDAAAAQGRNGNLTAQGELLAQIATIHESKGILFKAREYFMKALQIFQATNDEDRITRVKEALLVLKQRR